MTADLPTPALLLDLDAFESNLAAAADLVRGTGTLLRPHVKAHRTPGLALRQLGEVARGVTCATVGEAEAMAGAGIDDLLLANEIVTATKIDRMMTLAQNARVILVVDSDEGLEALSAAARRSGTHVDVLVDVDVGLGRCGVPDVGSARSLAAAVERAEGLRFAGIMGYEGRLRAGETGRAEKIGDAYRLLAEVKEAIEADGLPVETVSSAGTSTVLEAVADPVVTEIQAGTYALMESDLAGLGLPFRQAVSVASTVISRAPARVVLDGGRKSIGSDYGPPVPISADNARVTAFNEEHTVLAWDGPLPALGSIMELRPAHVRTTFNLHDEVRLVRAGRVEDRLPVSARGRSS